MKLQHILNTRIPPSSTNEGFLDKMKKVLSPQITAKEAEEMVNPNGPYRKNVQEFLSRTLDNKYFVQRQLDTRSFRIRCNFAIIDGKAVDNLQAVVNGLKKGYEVSLLVLKIFNTNTVVRQKLIPKFEKLGTLAEVKHLYAECKGDILLEDEEDYFKDHGGRRSKGVLGTDRQYPFPIGDDKDTFGFTTWTAYDNAGYIEGPVQGNVKEYTEAIYALCDLLDLQNKALKENDIMYFKDSSLSRKKLSVPKEIQVKVYRNYSNYLSPLEMNRQLTSELLAYMLYHIFPKKGMFLN